MEFAFLGWPADGPSLRLDYRRFSYAGKFVVTNTGKAVLREPETGGTSEASDGGSEFDDEVVAAVAFNEDRTDQGTLWLRYVTVRTDRRGEGLAPRLVGRVAERAERRGYERLRIAVNNPFAYEALYRAGFGYTGETTGIAELILERPADRSAKRYREGLRQFRTRDVELSEAEEEFLRRKRDAEPPTIEAE